MKEKQKELKKMEKEIEEILEQEEQRIAEEDKAHVVRGYVTGPRGMWDIRLETLRRMSVPELIEHAEKSEYRDLGVLKVIHDAYVSIARKYLTSRE